MLVGSDLSMMEAMGSYGRPFHQRGTEMVLGPLTPRDVGALTGSRGADTFDAWLVTGGLPPVCAELGHDEPVTDFLVRSLSRSTSALVVPGVRILAAELPVEAQARTALGVIGSGERSLSTIVARSACLRFFLRFVQPGLGEIGRGRGDVVPDRLRRDWTSWRGRAVEPVVRDAVERLPPDARLPGVRHVGGWWNRPNNPEVDLVGGDEVRPGRIGFVGSVTWREDAPFDRSDLAALASVAALVPGASSDTPLVAVSRSGVTAEGLAASCGPDDLLAAWPA